MITLCIDHLVSFEDHWLHVIQRLKASLAPIRRQNLQVAMHVWEVPKSGFKREESKCNVCSDVNSNTFCSSCGTRLHVACRTACPPCFRIAIGAGEQASPDAELLIAGPRERQFVGVSVMVLVENEVWAGCGDGMIQM